MDTLALIDSVMRLVTIGQMLLIGLVIGRGSAPRPFRLSAVALMVSLIAFMAISTPLFHLSQGYCWRLSDLLTHRAPAADAAVSMRPFALSEGYCWRFPELLSQSAPLLLWVFAHYLFERRLPLNILIGAGVCVLGCWTYFSWFYTGNATSLAIVGAVQRVVQFGPVVLALRIATSQWGNDLVEKRRLLRIVFVGLVGSMALAELTKEVLYGFFDSPPAFAISFAAAGMVLSAALGALLLQSDPDLLFDPAKPAPRAPTLTPSEQVLKAKLDAAMAGGIHRETGLTIGMLASRLAVPEHRLRALINQRMGHRNFAAFLNLHRIADARVMLADPTLVDLPILTIAMDLGYGSVAPFNRAFRDTIGQTPSDYRRAAFSEKS